MEKGINMKKRVSILLLTSVLIFATSCGFTESPQTNETEIPNSQSNNEKVNTEPNENTEVSPAESEEDIESIVKDRALEALKLIKDYDMVKFSEMVHPENGVRFTPYGYVDVENDLVFSKDEVSKLGTDSKIYVWGNYDGTGDPIELTFEDYYKKFIYDADFINAEQISINERLGQGNSLDNSAEVYKDAYVVEYHFSGFDPQYEGIDWKSLRLVLLETEGTWYIAGIIHDQWTI